MINVERRESEAHPTLCRPAKPTVIVHKTTNSAVSSLLQGMHFISKKKMQSKLLISCNMIICLHVLFSLLFGLYYIILFYFFYYFVFYKHKG